MEGYIVTIQNDTLRGKVAIKNDSLLLFENSQFKKELYTPSTIKAAFTDGKYFSVHGIMGHDKYFQEIITGYLSLYRQKYANTKENFFLKRNDTLFVVTPTNFLSFVSYLSAECKTGDSLSNKNSKQQYKYTLNDLSEFVDYYNTCTGHKANQVISYVPEKFSVKPVINLALDAHQFRLGNSNKYNSGGTFGHTLGFAAGISAKLLGKDIGFALQPGLQFIHREGEATLKVPLNSFTTVDANISSNFLQLPVLIRYSFASKGYRPYLSFGPHVGTAFKSQIKRTPHGFTYNDTFDEPGSNIELIYGVSGGAGIYFPNMLKGLEVELRADKSYYDNEVDMVGLQSSSLQLFIGFYLK